MLISWVISTDFSDVWEHGMWLRNHQIRFFMTADDCATWKSQWKALSRKTCFLYGTNELNAPFLGYLRHIRFQGMPNKHIQKTPFWKPYRHIDETNYVWNRLLIYIQCFCAKKFDGKWFRWVLSRGYSRRPSGEHSVFGWHQIRGMVGSLWQVYWKCLTKKVLPNCPKNACFGLFDKIYDVSCPLNLVEMGPLEQFLYSPKRKNFY